mgnify:CR=1 FL=1|tara:strand:+ start:17034 stop:17207 length:174 start_codon:yes stop_codon:yes gene_type:complete
MTKGTEVSVAQLAAIGISFSNVEQWLQMASLILAVTFGIYRWIVEIRTIREKRKNKK